MSRIQQYFFVLIMVVSMLGTGTTARADAGPADSEEMGQLFDVICLHAFPDPAALDREAIRLRATPMNVAQVQTYLHQDPGRGWYYATPLAHYAITVEQPPIAACAIRRMTPTGLPTVKPYLAAVNAYVASHKAVLTNLPAQQSKTAGGGDLSAYAQAIVAPGGKSATDIFITLLTNYHGRFQGELADGVGSGPGVEVRFVHQMPTHP